MSLRKIVGWCERCRADGLESPIQLYPVGRDEAIRMCSNLDCPDMVNGKIQSDIVKVDVMSMLHEFLPDPTSLTDPISLTDKLSDSDEEFDYRCSKVLTSVSSVCPFSASEPRDFSRAHLASVNTSGTAKAADEPLQKSSVDICEKAPSALGVNPSLGLLSEEHRGRICQDFGVPVSSHNALVPAKPFGEPTVGIGDSASTAVVCAKPLVSEPCQPSSEHVYRECQTSTSTCGDAGQAFVTQVEEPIVNSCDSVSWCANPDVCMDTEEPAGNICDSASLCADFSLCVDDEEPSSNIFDSALPCTDADVCMDAQEPTINICDSASLSADSSVCMDAEELTDNTSDSVLLCADSNVCVDTEEPTTDICDNSSACADSNVCMDMKKHVYRTPHNSAVTCGDANHVAPDKEKVRGVPVPDSAPTLSFSADTLLRANSHEHESRSRDAVHIPITALKATVRVTASSSDSDLDDSPITPSSTYLSSEAVTWKWNNTGEGHAFYTSLMPKTVAVKVVASSERPLCLSRAESTIDNPCLEKKKEECIEKTSGLFNLHQMEKVLKVKIVASSEVESGLCNNVSTPTLLPSNDTNSWLEVLPEELEDEVNYAVQAYTHEMVQEPAVRSVPAHNLESTKEPIVIGSPPLQLNTQKGDVKCNDVVSSPVTSPVSLVECHPEREHWERANVSPVEERMSRNSEGHVPLGFATESAYSACTTEDASMECSDNENIVDISTACVTNAAFSSVAALGTMNVENTFHDGCNMASHSETPPVSLSALSQEQEAISATVCDFSDSTEHCDDESSMPSTEGQPENYQRTGETPKLPKPLQEIGANAGPTTSHELDVVEVTINSPSHLDGSDEVVQECHYQEEQSCTISADQQNITVAKDSSAKVLSLPTRSEASLAEESEIASEVEISSTEPPKPLEKSVVTDDILHHLPCSSLSLHNISEESLLKNHEIACEVEISSTEPPKPLEKSVVTDDILHHLPCSSLSLHNISEESLLKNHEIACEVEISSTEPPEPLQKSGDAENVVGSDIRHLPCSPLNLPSGNELSPVENFTIAGEIEISTSEPPEHLQKSGDAESVVTNQILPSLSCCSNRLQSGEADLPEQLAIANEIPSVELPRSLAQEGQGTENTDWEFVNSQSKNQASSPGNLGTLQEASTDPIRPSGEGEASKAVAASNNPPALSVALNELPYLQTYSDASLSETVAIAGGTASLELPMSSKEPWRNTENVCCYLDLDASTCAPGGLPSLEGKTEGSLPICPGATNAVSSTELARPVLKESNIIQGSSQGDILATNETIPLSQVLCNEQADAEGVHMHDENFLSSAASYCFNSPSRSEGSSPEGSVVASKTYSVGLLEPSLTAHGDNSRTVINQPESSAAPNAITEPSDLSSRSGASALGPVEDPLEDPLAASLSIADSMSNMGHCSVVVQATSTEDLCANTSMTQKLPLQSSGLNVKHYTVLKGDAGGEGGCLSLAATAPPQRPTCSLKRTRSPSPSATFGNTARPSSHAGGGSGTLQHCVSTALLQPSTSALSNTPSSSDAQEGGVAVSKRARSGREAMKITIGTTAMGKAVVFSVTGLQKSMQNVVLKIPSNVVTGGNTQTAAVHPMSTRARAQNTRTKRQKTSAEVENAVASEGRKSKAIEEKKKSPPPPRPKVSRTGCAVMDKLAAINQALAVPIASESAPKNSKANARPQRQSGRICTNKKEKQPRKWNLALPRKPKQASSRKRKGGAASEQVVPDILQPVLSPSSSDLSSISSKPSKSSFSGASNNAASSVSTSKTGNSIWRSINSCKSAEEYVEVIKNRLFPVEEGGTGFPGYHPVLATRPPYNGDKKSTVIPSKRRRTKAATPVTPTTEAASATVGVELDRYVSELSSSMDVSHYDSVLAELFDCIT